MVSVRYVPQSSATQNTASTSASDTSLGASGLESSVRAAHRTPNRRFWFSPKQLLNLRATIQKLNDPETYIVNA